MEIRTLSQNKRLHYFLGKLKISGELKEELVYQATGFRTSRSSEMTPEECEALISHLTGMLRQNERGSYKATSRGPMDSKTRMQYKIFSICHEMQWEKDGGKVDKARLNEFCLKRGHKKKPFFQYTEKELPALVTQFERLLRSFYAEGQANI